MNKKKYKRKYFFKILIIFYYVDVYKKLNKSDLVSIAYIHYLILLSV